MKSKLHNNLISGMYIKINAFTDVSNRILEKIIKELFSNISKSTFDNIKELTENSIKSSKNDPPYKKAQKYFKKLVKNQYFMDDEVVLSNIDYEDYNKSIENLREKFKFEVLIHGYINEKLKNELIDIFNFNVKENSFINESKEYNSIRKHHLINGTFIYQNYNDLSTELNSAINNYYQLGERDIKNTLIMTLIQMIISNSYYDELRTNKQLGYVVYSDKVIIDRIMYYLILVQGRKTTPNKINSIIDETTNNLIKDKIENFTNDELESLKKNLFEVLNKNYVNLSEKTVEIFKEIDLGTFEFERKNLLKEELYKVRLTDLQLFFKNIFYDETRKVSIQIFAKQDDLKSIDKKSESESYSLNPKLNPEYVNLESFKKTKLIG